MALSQTVVRWAVAGSVALASPAVAQFVPESLDRLDLLSREPSSVVTVTPVYAQLVVFSLPDDFHTVATTTGKARFAQQSVATGESVARWTQRITLAGDEAMAFSARTWPQRMVDDFAARMRKNCPDSFSTLPIANVFVGSSDTAAAVAACGSIGGRSEAVLQLVVKGGMDVYTIEWAVRGPADGGPRGLVPAPWTGRLRSLGPIKLCRRIPGEEPPYPSCSRRR